MQSYESPDIQVIGTAETLTKEGGGTLVDTPRGTPIANISASF